MSIPKKLLCAAMFLVLLFNSLSVGISAVLGDGNQLSVDINLELGTYSGNTWVPLSAGATLAVNDVVTVRICPKTDFLCGATSYAVMFSQNYFQIEGVDNAAFTPNENNDFYDQVAFGYKGYTTVISDNWPSALVSNGDFNKYTAVIVRNMANSNSNNGGYPGYLEGDWLFQFNLLVTKNITAGSNARIWMDSRWFKNPENTHAAAYFVKCDYPNELSSLGESRYYYDFDLSGADISLPTPAVTSTITFNSAGGSAVAPITGNVGSPVTVPLPPMKTGYTFTGWNPELPAMFPVGGLNTTAQWAVKKTTITFNSFGGSAVDSITADYNSKVNAPLDPTRSGYHFDGWFYDTAYLHPVTWPLTMPADSMTLVAKWTNTVTYNFILDPNNGTGLTQNTLEANTEIYQPDDPEKEGFTFTGWYYDNDTFLNEVEWPLIMPANNLTIYAKWAVNSYTVTFNANGGSGGTSSLMEYGSAITIPAVTLEGYTLDYWSPEVPAVVPAENVTYSAQWKVNTYNAYFMVNNTAYATVPTEYGADIHAPADPAKTGYTFTGWDPSVGKMGAGDMTFSAKWSQNIYYIYYMVDGRLYKKERADNHMVVYIDPSINLTGKTGYTFYGWDSNIPTMPDHDVTVNAVYKINTHNADFWVDDTLYATVPTEYGAAIHAPEDPVKQGYTFTGWAPEVGIMEDKDVTFTATFKINSYEAIFMVDGKIYTVTPTTFKSEINMPIPLKEGYTFAGWYTDEALTKPAVLPCIIGASNVTFYVNWTKNPPQLNVKSGSTAKLDSGSHIISGLQEGMTSASFIKNDINISGNGSLVIVTYSHDSFGTGTKVTLIDNDTGAEVATYNIVIFGDVDGDGYVTAADNNTINLIASYQAAFEDNSAFKNAADVNRDGIIDSFDVNIIRASLNGIGVINQMNS